MLSKEEQLKFMEEAIKEAYEGIKNNDGGPFGSVIVKDGKIVGKGHNQVLKNNDPTCHGEIMAIHDACKNLGTFDLTGCDLFTSGECCTMCLCATLWSNINHVYYAATLQDNDMIGFRDVRFDELLGGREKLNKTNYCTEVGRDLAIKLFEDYLKTNPQNY